MALSAGNRTWYDPTHGISWRGSQLPFNTFYAVLCLVFFFFMALICRLGYKGYRMEIRKAAKKTAAIKLAIARQQEQRRNLRHNGTAPAGILKTDRGQTEDGRKVIDTHVQFAGGENGWRNVANNEGTKISTVKFFKLESEECDRNGQIILHL